MARHKKLSIEAMRWAAKQRGGSCLSDTYVNDVTKLKWQCGKGHIWDAKPGNVWYMKTWCPFCAGTNIHRKRHSLDTHRLSIEEMRTLAKSRGGLCLSDNYVNCYTKLRWQCKKGHLWEATTRSVKHQGGWCPFCVLRHKTTRKPFAGKFTIEDARQLAHSKGGKCLSQQYVNSEVKLTWQCATGHIWDAPYYKIRYENWCPVCAGTRRKSSHNEHTIIHDKKYRTINTTNKSLNEMQQIARQNKGKCLSAFYINTHTELRWQCQDGHIWMASPRAIKFRQKWCPDCPASKYDNALDKLRLFKETLEFAKQRGGNCLSTKYAYEHISKDPILRWQCSKGHTWKKKAQAVKSGNWCPLCVKAQSFLQKLQQLVQKQGVRCLSTEYFNEAKILRWQCNKGHVWDAPPRKIKTSKKFCPVCYPLRHDQALYSFALYEKAC